MAERIEFGGWPNCARLATADIEVVVTTDIGPRIVAFGAPGGPNLMTLIPKDLGKIGGTDWRLYGGHRLWHAPEHPVHTYQPDNHPLRVIDETDQAITLVQAVEPATGIEKTMTLTLADAGQLRVDHRLTNTNSYPIKTAAWGITALMGGGIGVMPFPPRRPHPQALQAETGLVLWAYTDLSDPRYRFGQQFLWLQHDSSATTPQKIGRTGEPGWLAYWLDGWLFIKQFPVRLGATYPDEGACAEIYTDAGLLELESLGPMVKLAPDEQTTHTELWQLFANVPAPTTDAIILTEIVPRLATPPTW